MTSLFTLAPTHPVHHATTQASAAGGGISLSVLAVAVIAGWYFSTHRPHPLAAAVCWITVGASGFGLAVTVHDLFAAVVHGVGSAFGSVTAAGR